MRINKKVMQINCMAFYIDKGMVSKPVGSNRFHVLNRSQGHIKSTGINSCEHTRESTPLSNIVFEMTRDGLDRLAVSNILRTPNRLQGHIIGAGINLCRHTQDEYTLV